jgi:hypothetical protein
MTESRLLAPLALAAAVVLMALPAWAGDKEQKQQGLLRTANEFADCGGFWYAMRDHLNRLADSMEKSHPAKARQARDNAQVANDTGNGALLAVAFFLMGPIDNKAAFELAKAKVEGAHTTWRAILWNMDDPRVKPQAGECNRLREAQQQAIDFLENEMLTQLRKGQLPKDSE